VKRFDPAGAAGRDVLLVAPHPDDEALGCGGSVHLMARAGARVAVVVMARGDGGVDGRTAADGRQAEAQRACEILGTEAPLFADLGSAALRAQPGEAAGRLDRMLGARRFDMLLVPSPLERHATHRACLLATLLASVAREGAAWWGYGVWDALPAVEDVVEVDVTAARSAKTRAVRAHESQDGARPLAAGMASRDLDQAVFSAITGDEDRKAIERLLSLDGLWAALPRPLQALRGAAGERPLGELVAQWLAARQQAWTRTLWGLPPRAAP